MIRLMTVDPGYKTLGSGPLRVLVLHDWFCDSSGWEPVLPYLTPEQFTYAFVDLRGYGASRGMEGACTLDEASSDAIAIAGKLCWTEFSLIGHSMSGLIVQRIARLASERIQSVVAVTPVPPAGLAMDDASLNFFRSIALGTDEERFAALAPMWGTRLSETWIRWKLRRWRQTSDPETVARYVDLWGRAEVQNEANATRMLIVAGEHDAPPFQPGALERSMLPHYSNAKLIAFGDCGHYPMQEQPPLLATVIENFLGAK